MDIIAVTLLAIIISYLIYAIYDNFFLPNAKGATQLKVKLKRKHRIDGIILLVIMAILLHQTNLTNLSAFTLYLFGTCLLLIVHFYFIRTPYLLLKPTGFYLFNIFILYNKIQTMKLSEDGILVIDLKNGKQLLINVVDPEDLSRILQFFIDQEQK